MSRPTITSTGERVDERLDDFGGRHAIAGFLFQILRSVQLGLRLTAFIQRSTSGGPHMQLTLEPVEGGDHRVRLGPRRIVEQVKMRAAHRFWSTGEVARKVIPDLLRASSPDLDQAFCMVTNNERGLGELRRFLNALRVPGAAQADLQYKWGREHLSSEAFAARIATQAGVEPDDPSFRAFLSNFTIELVDSDDVEREIDALLEPLLTPGQRAEDKREELTARLFKAARDGRTLHSADLLGLIHPEAQLRLAHAQSLRPILHGRIAADCAALGYDAASEARVVAPDPAGPLTIFSGESGQGKTWSLCQSALELSGRGELAVVLRAPRNFDRLIQLLNERLWFPAYQHPVAPQVMAQRLAGHWRRSHGFWLTLFIDDLQDRTLAQEIAGLDWHRHGIRLVVSSQPRITKVLDRSPVGAQVERIGNFTSAELRRYLRHHGRDEPLESMPDDVFELLLKPIHARIFTQLPTRSSWTGVTEYELFQTYWRFATRQARAQRDHPSDREGLVMLASSLLGDRPRYPFLSRDLRAAGLDDAAVGRLEQVGLVRWIDDDHLAFASDRMLNWAVAESLTARIVDESWTHSQAEAELHRIDEIETPDGEPVGRRLGYVFLDTIWLLTGATRPDFLAELILDRVRRLPHEWRGEQMWEGNLATVGASLLPALEALAFREFDEGRDYDIPWHIPLAVVAIGLNDRTAIEPTVRRLIASENEAGMTAALKIAGRVPIPELLDLFWRIHLEREIALEAVEATEERNDWRDHFSRRQLSSQAVKTALRLDADWLDGRIGAAWDPFELDKLLWMLTNGCVGDAQANQIWVHHRTHLLSRLSTDSRAMINALGHFADAENRAWLNNVTLSRDDYMSARVLSSRARIDPVTALQQIRNRDEDYGWSAADWWLPELARVDPVGTADAIRENAIKGDHPLTDVILHYANYPELMDGPTFEWVLDEFAFDLQTFNDKVTQTPDNNLGRLGHPLRFLNSLTEPWQFELVARRAGSLLESELVRLATRRRGRSGRLRDSEGNELERLLAMIDGQGFNALVVAELERADAFAREDGYVSARWTESDIVTAALEAAEAESEPDNYRQVVRMEALAIHKCDAALEAMVRAGSPIYVNAAEMRSADGRPTDKLRERVEALVETGDITELGVAAELAGFLREPEETRVLIPAFLSSDTPASIRRWILATFKALQFYEPSFLATTVELMADRIDNEGQFVASYLARFGDADARAAVVGWLAHLDLGTWSSSHDAFLLPLLKHDDSRAGVVEFLRRSRARGHLLIRARYLRVLAEDGDVEAQDELVRSAYREPRFGSQSTAGGILFLRESDPDEAFFAARRYFVRQEAQDAIDLMLQIDAERAVPILLERYRSAKPAVQCEIARRLRAYLPPERQLSLLDALTSSALQEDRMVAIELAGWFPPSLDLPWLDNFADSGSQRLKVAARSALRARAKEAAGMQHLQAMQYCSKPSRWARLQTVFECVDPDALWTRDDPASLQEFLESNPPEFGVEARQLRRHRTKQLDDQARKAGQES